MIAKHSKRVEREVIRRSLPSGTRSTIRCACGCPVVPPEKRFTRSRCCYGERQPEGKIHLFATDIDQHAIEIARAGNYPESILTDVPPTRLNRFFNHAGSRYVIDKSVREKVLFAPHNILRDPPFSQVDFVSCRNLLIYLDRAIQREIFQTFHFALKPGGFLFLGSSESAEVADDLFIAIDKKNRIYQAKILTSRPRASAASFPRLAAGPAYLSIAARPVTERPRLETADLHRRAIEHGAPSQCHCGSRRRCRAYVWSGRAVFSLSRWRAITQPSHADPS